MRLTTRLGVMLFLALSFGCARMVVTKNPGPSDKGIRFYRPKPYIFIGPAPPTTSSSSKNEPDGQTSAGGRHSGDRLAAWTAATDPAPAMSVVIRLEYLPDYSEEYSIRVTPGLGQSELNVSLQNGWNLTSVDAKTDQRYAEILGSLAQLLSAVPKAGAEMARNAQADNNVPLGYYEGVLAINERGCKELLGWRYVGFMPCYTCPVKANVYRTDAVCDDDHLYALVFEGGTLRFKTMRDMKFGAEPKKSLNCPCSPNLGAGRYHAGPFIPAPGLANAPNQVDRASGKGALR